ncbi:MAG: formate dehydrogenase subunit alpha, partial [Hyphomicrobiales bacterium]
DACIACSLCVRACREVQVNDVIGMAWRGTGAQIVFDQGDDMGASTCVACGECVAVCPTGALMPASLLDAEGIGSRDAHAVVNSVCPYCGVGCQIAIHVRDGKIAYVEGRDGPANENRLCVKGRFGTDYIHHPHRLTTPLIRRDDAPKTTELDIDPANPLSHFREASWEEALAVAAGGLARVRDAHGGNALAGFGSAKCSNEEAYLFQKLVRTGFETNNVDHCTRLCHASSVAALMEGIGSGAVTAPFNAAMQADAIIVIGSNPTNNHPVAATFFKQAAKAGADLIVIDPRGHALKRHATHMLQFTPGADVALLNAMLNVIITDGLQDSQYIQAHTQGFEEFSLHIQQYSPEAMSPICGISPEAIASAARCFAKAKRGIIFWGMGVSQHTHGTDNARCLIALALACGHVGRPGTGLHPLRGQNNVQGASDAGLIPMFLPDYGAVDNDEVRGRFEKLWAAKLDPKPGLTVVEITQAMHARSVRAMYIMCENPAMSDPDVAHARAAFAKLDHLVVQDIFLTETAMFADVVLPATAWPEKTGTATNTNRQIQMGRQAIDAPGDARPDWWIVIEMAKGLGLNWAYEGPAEVFAEMTLAMGSLANISWERLQREDAVTYPCPAPDAPGAAIVFADRFPTDDGRARFVGASVLPPNEVPDDDYPMVLTTGRQLEHWHTGAMTRRAANLDALEPEATASIAPGELARLNIATGDRVRVSSRRGSITLMARVDPGLAEGVVFIPFAFREAAANLLTNAALDPVGKIPEFKYCAVRVEPARADAADAADDR